MSSISDYEVFVYSIPMTTRFRGITVREVFLIRGKHRWAEFSPFEDYSDAQCVPWLHAALDFADGDLPPARRRAIPVTVTIPATTPARARNLAAASGCATAKVKVAEKGQGLDQDVERVRAVRQALGPRAAIRLDANGAWDLASAARAIAVLEEAAGGLEYVEQPCPDIESLRALRAMVDVPVAADESIRLGPDPAAAAEHVDVVVMKVQPLGGVRRCVELARRVGRPVVVSSALETAVGIGMGLALAAALEELPHACGLATTLLFDKDVLEPAPRPADGMLPVGPFEPDRRAMAACAAPGAVREAWLARLGRVGALLPVAAGDPS
jgi:O-succinylbenzoate synthase